MSSTVDLQKQEQTLSTQPVCLKTEQGRREKKQKKNTYPVLMRMQWAALHHPTLKFIGSDTGVLKRNNLSSGALL